MQTEECHPSGGNQEPGVGALGKECLLLLRQYMDGRHPEPGEQALARFQSVQTLCPLCLWIPLPRLYFWFIFVWTSVFPERCPREAKEGLALLPGSWVQWRAAPPGGSQREGPGKEVFLTLIAQLDSSLSRADLEFRRFVRQKEGVSLLLIIQASLIAQLVRNPPAMQETPVRSLGREVPLEKG